MKQFILTIFFAGLIVALMIISGAFYTVHETEQVIKTEFGKVIGKPITTAGLKFKMPFIQKVNKMPKNILEWDGAPTEMPTRDKLYIKVDIFARWEIADAKLYFETLNDERSALSRLDDILGGEAKSAVAKHDLIEIIRTTKGRKPKYLNREIESDTNNSLMIGFNPIKNGRSTIEADILESAKPKLKEFGIELLNIRFKRINYNEDVESKIFQRMISERQQIADRFRSEGLGEAAKISGNMEKELKKISSESYKKVQKIQGDADAKAASIYAKAYAKNDNARELYEFLKKLNAFKKILTSDTTMILSTDSDLLKLLKSETSLKKDD